MPKPPRTSSGVHDVRCGFAASIAHSAPVPPEYGVAVGNGVVVGNAVGLGVLVRVGVGEGKSCETPTIGTKI